MNSCKRKGEGAMGVCNASHRTTELRKVEEAANYMHRTIQTRKVSGTIVHHTIELDVAQSLPG